MAEDLQWFKFSPLKWMAGRIRKEKDRVQIAFLVLSCQYWKEGCKMTIEKARDEIGDTIDLLINKRLIKTDGEKIQIGFLDEQIGAINETSEQRKAAAKVRWDKQKHKSAMQSDASAMHVHEDAMQSDAEREEKREKTRQDQIISEWISWGELIVAGKDQYWDNMRGRKISQKEMNKFISVATRKKWDLPTQHAFRVSLQGFFDDEVKPKHGIVV